MSCGTSTILYLFPDTLRQDEKRMAGRNNWDTFSQLKKVSSQWQEIAKRYVPKTDKEFWKMIRKEVTPRVNHR